MVEGRNVAKESRKKDVNHHQAEVPVQGKGESVDVPISQLLRLTPPIVQLVRAMFNLPSSPGNKTSLVNLKLKVCSLSTLCLFFEKENMF